MNQKSMLLIAVGLTVAGGLSVLFVSGHSELTREQEREKPVQAPSRLSTGSEGPVVTLSTSELQAAAIATASLQPMTRTATLPAFAEVLDIAPLATDIARYQRLMADLAKSEAALSVASQVEERSRRLHDDDRNISDQALEAAEATLHTESSNHAALLAERDSTLSNLRLNWGPSLLAGIGQKSGALSALLDGRASLLRVSLGATGGTMVTPSMVELLSPDGVRAARVLGPAPRADDHLQGPAVLALSSSVLPVGMRLAAQWPQGGARRGVEIPASAVVWWQGLPWVYRQLTPGHFQREPLYEPEAITAGWFVQHGLATGMLVVVRGAQLLLSEEQRGSIPMGEDGGE